MRTRRRLSVWLLPAMLLSGCYTFGASISILPADQAASFTLEEQENAKGIALEIGRAAGFWQTDVAEILAASPSSSPYVAFVSLGAPGGNPEHRYVSIMGRMRKDRRELEISVGDDMRGEPTPATAQLIEELHVALQRAFPDCRVAVTHRKELHLFAP